MILSLSGRVLRALGCQVLIVLVASFAVARAFGEAREYRDVRDLVRDNAAAAFGETNRVCQVMGLVTHASGIRPGTYVIHHPAQADKNGVIVTSRTAEGPVEGDIVAVSGTTYYDAVLRNLCIAATSIEVMEHGPLPKAPTGKYADVRRGLVGTRRLSLPGKVSTIVTRGDAQGEHTIFSLSFDNSQILCRVPGRLPARFNDVPVIATGVVFNEWNESGTVCMPSLELPDTGALALQEADWLRYVLIALSATLAVLLGAFVAFWLRVRRDRLVALALGKDRQRLAADLHDTIEQHLASARLLLTCALKPPDIPPDTVQMITHAEEVLGHAKAEVRATVMNLRNDAALTQSPAAALQALADSLGAKGAIHVVTQLRGLPERLPPDRHRDMLLIVREAVTNAVKHGKAHNVRLVSSPWTEQAKAPHRATRGGFVLSILNDGMAFDVAAALGPETGHFGLAGMHERAARSGFGLTIASRADLTEVRLEVPL